MTDLATRAYNHTWRIDPVIRSLLDTDFYKLLMQQHILTFDPDVCVRFSLINRTKSVRLADIIDIADLRDQLDHVRTLRFTKEELIWLAGNTFYGTTSIFKPDYIDYLRGYSLPEYRLAVENGQYVLEFEGPWADVTLWEIYALAIVSTLRNRVALKTMSRLDLDVLYARFKTRLWDKLIYLRDMDVTGVADFGSRRRHDFLAQEWAVLAASDVLRDRFTGTSNALIAMRHGLEAIGTNAHELPMVKTALASDASGMRQAQYGVLEKWQQTYDKRLLVMLPDTYGTTQFLKHAPAFVNDWTGARIDSKDPYEAAEELIAWWRSRGCNPEDKLILFSDGLDAEQIADLHRTFVGRARLGFGWGTLLTNDFRDCHPQGLPGLDPISLVCKVTAADGHPAVKLSDNVNKPTGIPAEVARYRTVFGNAGVGISDVIV